MAQGVSAFTAVQAKKQKEFFAFQLFSRLAPPQAERRLNSVSRPLKLLSTSGGDNRQSGDENKGLGMSEMLIF